MNSNDNGCQHQILQLDPSPFAVLAGYEQPSAQKRASATTISGRATKSTVSERVHTYPAPLVLPHDELNYDPDYLPQSVYSWLHAKSRNKMTSNDIRDTLYIGRVPMITDEVCSMRDWTTPLMASVNLEKKSAVESPDATLLVDYLKAFYHGMNVEILPGDLRWTSWGKSNQSRGQVNLPKYVGLAYGSECTRIRLRHPPDGAFAAQLNLDDIIDALISALPANAYSLMLLVDHDIYENDDDDFCCGRAYGGSRVAVVQTARYNPVLDQYEKIDQAHSWPLSHCKDFVDELCAVEDVEPKPPSKRQIEASTRGPMRAAVNAAMLNNSNLCEDQEYTATWFSRLARTVSHEFGHCFGIDHCVYYACNMQGTSGMKEDVRQPPYLCPVCEAKVGHAIAGELQDGGNDQKNVWKFERCHSLRKFCTGLQAAELDTTMWRGMDAWLEARLTDTA